MINAIVIKKKYEYRLVPFFINHFNILNGDHF